MKRDDIHLEVVAPSDTGEHVEATQVRSEQQRALPLSCEIEDPSAAIVLEANAVERAGKSLEDLRIAEVVDLDMTIKDGKVESYRAKLKVSFKFRD